MSDGKTYSHRVATIDRAFERLEQTLERTTIVEPAIPVDDAPATPAQNELLNTETVSTAVAPATALAPAKPETAVPNLPHPPAAGVEVAAALAPRASLPAAKSSHKELLARHFANLGGSTGSVSPGKPGWRDTVAGLVNALSAQENTFASAPLPSPTPAKSGFFVASYRAGLDALASHPEPPKSQIAFAVGAVIALDAAAYVVGKRNERIAAEEGRPHAIAAALELHERGARSDEILTELADGAGSEKEVRTRAAALDRQLSERAAESKAKAREAALAAEIKKLREKVEKIDERERDHNGENKRLVADGAHANMKMHAAHMEGANNDRRAAHERDMATRLERRDDARLTAQALRHGEIRQWRHENRIERELTRQSVPAFSESSHDDGAISSIADASDRVAGALADAGDDNE